MKLPVATAQHGKAKVELIQGPLPEEARRLYEGTWSRSLPDEVMYGRLMEDVTFPAEVSLALFLDKRPALPPHYYLKVDALTSHLRFSDSELSTMVVSSLAHVEMHCDHGHHFPAGFVLFVCGVIDYHTTMYSSDVSRTEDASGVAKDSGQ